MKWIKIDCFGNKQVWYSEDVIDRIYNIAKECNYLDAREAITDILDIIESEEI